MFQRQSRTCVRVAFKYRAERIRNALDQKLFSNLNQGMTVRVSNTIQMRSTGFGELWAASLPLANVAGALPKFICDLIIHAALVLYSTHLSI